MKRLHLIELHEQPWCPQAVRDGATDCLRAVSTIGRQYHNALPKLVHVLRQMNSHTIIDLCSGGGGPWCSLIAQLREHGPYTVTLTDLYPNHFFAGAEAARCSPHLAYEMQPIDATEIPPHLTGCRTLFTTFHHFTPGTAADILRDAACQGQGIAIFEQTRRSLPALALMLVLAPAALLVTPFLRPFRLSRLVFTYLLPLIPLVLCFDGIVSCLRTYHPQELLELAAPSSTPGYTWEAGRLPSPLSPLGITYLIGWPTKS